MILADTDILIDVLRNHPTAVQWLNGLVGDLIAIPGYAALELLDGARNKQQLQSVNRLLSEIEIIWPSRASCQQALKTFNQVHLSNGIGVLDILMAYTAVQLNLLLHTFNTRHYAIVPGLQTIQPYTR